MSRIEKGSNTTEELQELKGEVIKEIKSQRKSKPWCACSLVLLLCIIGILTSIVWGVAATGLVTVPGFIKFAYQKPEPERLVTSGVPIETVINQQVQTTLTQRLQAGGGKLEDASVTFALDEKSLTASLRSVLEESGDTMLDPALAQVMVTQEKGFTFFLPFGNSVNRTALQISVKATAKDGTLILTPEAFSIGSLQVPNVITAFFLQPFVNSKLANLNKALGSYMEIQDLTYEEGKAIVKGKFSVKIMNGQQ